MQSIQIDSRHSELAQLIIAQLRAEDVPWMDIFSIMMAGLDFLSSMTAQPPFHLLDNAICGIAQLPHAAQGKFAQVVLAALAEHETPS